MYHRECMMPWAEMNLRSNANCKMKGEKVGSTSSANFIKMVVRGRCCPSTGTKCAVTTAGKPALSKTPFNNNKIKKYP